MPRPFPTRDKQSHNRANGSVFHDPGTNLGNWDINLNFADPESSISQVTFDNRSCYKLDVKDSYSIQLQRTIPNFNNSINTFSIKIWLSNQSSGNFSTNITKGTQNLVINIYEYGRLIVGETIYDSVIVDSTWMEFTFSINWTSGDVGIYKDGTLIGTALAQVQTYPIAGDYRLHFGAVTGNDEPFITYIDWIKVGNKLV